MIKEKINMLGNKIIDYLHKNPKLWISIFIRLLFITFTGICLFAPPLLFCAILIYLLFELSYLVHVYFDYLNDLYDIDFEETHSQRQIISFHFYLTASLSIVSIIFLHYFEKSFDFSLINDCIFNGEEITLLSLTYYLIRFVIMFFVISKIHEHVLINKMIGFENNYPPLCKLFSTIINKIKYGNENYE